MTCPRAGSAEYAAYYQRQASKRTEARPCPVCGRLTRWRRPRRASLDLNRDAVCSVACVELARHRKNQAGRASPEKPAATTTTSTKVKHKRTILEVEFK